MYVLEDSKLLDDQRKFMSINATLMYASKRTHPEISFPVVYLSSRYNKATEDDHAKAMRVAEYIGLSYPSLQLVAKSDASYADAKSHTMWLSTKQPIVASSTCESELIATCTVGCAVEWAKQFVQELGFTHLTAEIGVDNKCSMRLLEQGTGSFKRAKHIKVRFFWLKDLIDGDEIILVYVPSEELMAGRADQGDHGSAVQVSSWQASGPDGRGCLGWTRQHNYNEEEC